jgi:hypothetical protein
MKQKVCEFFDVPFRIGKWGYLNGIEIIYMTGVNGSTVRHTCESGDQ